ncbi:chemotaxis protein [Phenylobacterium sp. Root77]|uniref:HAMP domain-containing methyl-accepting chemotaxis protein n=1 Tax=unclassified Phenylobacterium TaxID=2640670 RepID=UPI0006FFA36E|nr:MULTISPECIES: methyl-accepting chemotaxis protein [unclassified Phenylobacterium]KQW69242.1 chemotaxis protein [Phenylobacterium sp. Root1277]KQW95391.1 chemotaxis protein [Phenylobacterium sp. Root1290]KRC41181.1 chemotaxis protein [Phenylobacterium sp. Root77]
MNFSNARITTKLIMAFAVILSVFTLASTAVFLSLGVTQKAAQQNNVSNLNTQDVIGVLYNVVEQQNATRGFAATRNADLLKDYDANGAAADKNLADFAQRTTRPEQRERAARLKTAIEAWRAKNNEIIALARDPATEFQALAMIDEVRLGDIRVVQGEIMEGQRKLVAQRWEQQQSALGQARITLIGGSIVAILAAAAMAWLLSRAIAAPVNAMTRAMDKLAGGDNSVDVPAVGRKDEIGQMANAVLAFKEAAIQKLRVEAEVAEQRTAAELERKVREEEKAREAEQDAVAIGALGEAMGKLAHGDLTHRITAAFAPKAEQLKTDFNAAVATLQDTMKVISGNTTSMRSGAGEISQAADDLSRRTEQQAASLEETAAALDEITATVRKTAEGANHAREVVETARVDAERSAAVVNRATAAMGEIEESSRQIGQIIGVIDEIAFQTNLLALNAGVEAARAGDAGKGFAVVASEVRALAQRSAEAAKEIKALINASTGQVGQGVELVAETGKALQRIAAQVAEINGSVSEIAASAQEQAVGLQQVNTAVNQMDQVTQQNAAMVEESTAASHALANEAVELSRLMGQFSIGQDQGRPIARKAPPAPRVNKPVASRGYSSGAATAAKLEPVGEADTWEEF